MSKRRINVPKHPGIRKDVVTGHYQALKKIKGKQYSETFENIRDAIHWKNTFDGDRSKKAEVTKTTSTLGHVWSRMKILHFPSLELSTQRIWERRWEPLSELAEHHMEEITSTVINRWIKRRIGVFKPELIHPNI